MMIVVVVTTMMVVIVMVVRLVNEREVGVSTARVGNGGPAVC